MLTPKLDARIVGVDGLCIWSIRRPRVEVDAFTHNRLRCWPEDVSVSFIPVVALDAVRAYAKGRGEGETAVCVFSVEHANLAY